MTDTQIKWRKVMNCNTSEHQLLEEYNVIKEACAEPLNRCMMPSKLQL